MRIRQSLRAHGHHRRGGVMVLALFSVLLVVGFAASFLRISSTSAGRQLAAVDAGRALYLAEAGLAEAYRGLCIGKTGAVGSELEPAGFGDGLFWVEASDAGGGRVALQSTGMVGTSRVVLSLVAEPGDGTTLARAVFTADDLTILPGTRIDSYDSSKGSYADQKGEDARLEGALRVGSNGDVTVSGTLEAPTLIRGDVNQGPAKALTLDGEVLVSGETGAAPMAHPLPPVDLPVIAKLPGVEYGGALPLVVAAGEHGADYLHVGPDSEVIMQGPMTILLGGLRLEKGAQLTADTTAGAVEVFVEDYLELAGDSVVENTTQDPGQLVFQYAGVAPAKLYSGPALEAVVYAPLAEILVGLGAEIFGSLVAKELTFRGAATVHFDRALVSEAANLTLPRIMTWRIIDLGRTGGGVVDPFVYLGVDPALLPGPAAAHEDQILDVTYTDLGGATQVFNGWESSFDWTQVKGVDSLSRDGQSLDGAGEEPAPKVLPADEQATVDYMNGLPVPLSTDIKTRLVTESPLSTEVLVESVLSGRLTMVDLKDVLVLNSPLDPTVLTMIMDDTAGLDVLNKLAVMAAQ